MKLLCVGIVLLGLSYFAGADTFGTGENQFTIEFVTISGDSGNLGSWSAGWEYTFSGVNHGDYRIGKFEITNDQWTKFINVHGKPDGSPSNAYDADPYWTGANVPTNNVSWYEAAQFVNWLNIEAGKTAAYKFTGTPGTSNYTLGVWGASDAWGGTNLYRHKDAHYFLPTEDEWVKAAYWNGKTLQEYAIKSGESLHQGDGISGTGWNYYDVGDSTDHPFAYGPWDVGSGSEELNGTFDMMGNVWEWMEGPFISDNYTSDGSHRIRGGSRYYYYPAETLGSSYRDYGDLAHDEHLYIGFRVASVPEPASLGLLFLGGLLIRRMRFQ